ncbi:MAG TPA: zinc ribbon domain-containing protein [Thermoplasmata archaeon]|nr:zinc ribbon domain-containing protein [Thermoplasmata archaeon]
MADTTTWVIAAMLLTLAGVGLLELRYLRRRRTRRESEVEGPDKAHNALITTKAIRDALARGGVRSPEAEGLIQEADDSYRQRHFRVAVELSGKAKSVLRAVKLRHQQQGDIAKLDEIPAAKEAAGAEITDKERLMKELPPNYAQSKFSMGVARADIDAAKARGVATADAERFLADAQVSFEAQDFDIALKHAVRARRSLENNGTEAGPPAAQPAAPTSRTCASCGASLTADDAFCRKCGTKAGGPRTCPSCGAEVPGDDAFCRKCGTKILAVL